MKFILLAALLLAGCGSVPAVDTEQTPVDETTDQTTGAAVKETNEQPANTRRRRAENPKRATTTPPPPVELLPPCEVDLSDPREAVLQKLDCVLETADGLPKPDK